MLNLNGVYIQEDALVSILAEQDGVHISLSNHATYLVPVPEGFTPAEYADRIAFAIEQPGEDYDEPVTMEIGEPTPWTPTEETQRDIENAKYYADGWFAACKEANLQVLNGTFDVFFESQVKGFQDAQTPKVFADPAALFELDDPVPLTDAMNEFMDDFGKVRKATDSGEPEQEAAPVDEPNKGTWHITDDELQGMLETAREAGADIGRNEALTTRRQTTRSSLDMIVQEIIGDSKVSSRFDLAYALANRLGYDVADINSEIETDAKEDAL